MARFMLDTDIASCVMKGSSPSVMKKLARHAISDVCISVITKCELIYGVEISPRRNQDQARLDVLLRHIVVLDFPEHAALDYGQIRGHLKQTGQMIGANDLLIAAHARCLAMTLVTNNTREFNRVPGLKLENWA